MGARADRKKKPAVAEPSLPVEDQVQAALSWLDQNSTPHDRDNLVRFGINATKAFGVSMANIQLLAKRLGRNQELASALWDTGWYEARLLTSFVGEPARITPEQMDLWCHDFDNWGICDTICFHLFDRTPYAWAKVAQWRGESGEFAKRAAFALLASLAGHDKNASDNLFAESLPWIEDAATDERNFVKKGVNWALRRIGRRNAALNSAAVEVARRLADSPVAAARWTGKDALRELTSPAVVRSLKSRKGNTRMKKLGDLTIDRHGDREIIMTRGFHAPRHLVFDAHTKPELVKRWLGVRAGWRLAVCEIDLTVGGAYRYVWRHETRGKEMGMGGVYREIVRPERLVCTEVFDDPWYPGEALQSTVLLEQEGGTMLVLTVRYESPEAREMVLKSPMEGGVAESYRMLANLLEEMGRV